MGGAFRKLWFVQESKNGQSLLLFFVKPANKHQAIKIKCAQKHFESVLGHHTDYQKKKLSKTCQKRAHLVFQKETKESKLSLGSWLVVWAANEICTFLPEFKSLKNKKKKLPYEQALRSML